MRPIKWVLHRVLLELMGFFYFFLQFFVILIVYSKTTLRVSRKYGHLLVLPCLLFHSQYLAESSNLGNFYINVRMDILTRKSSIKSLFHIQH